MHGAYLAGLTIEAHGDTAVQTREGKGTGEDELASTDNQTFDSTDDARSRIPG